jgi:hypothetical protein
VHTDEYEISLSREIDVCRSRIRTIRKALSKMEQKYGTTTEQFLDDSKNGAGKISGDDAAKWAGNCKALTVWQGKQAEFEALYLRMKK